MTNPQRPEDPRLSTADLAAATERTSEPNVPEPAPRPAADREVTTPPAPGADARTATAAEQDLDQERLTSLFGEDEADDFRQRWSDIQTGFVDEPRQAVERADALVAAAIKRLAEIFAQERSTLEQQWARGGDVSTEDLRVAMRRYRGFFDRLLSV